MDYEPPARWPGNLLIVWQHRDPIVADELRRRPALRSALDAVPRGQSSELTNSLQYDGLAVTSVTWKPSIPSPIGHTARKTEPV